LAGPSRHYASTGPGDVVLLVSSSSGQEELAGRPGLLPALHPCGSGTAPYRLAASGWSVVLSSDIPEHWRIRTSRSVAGGA
jgi:hypothetical protein